MVKRDDTNSRSANVTITPAHMAMGRSQHRDQGLRVLKMTFGLQQGSVRTGATCSFLAFS